MGQSSSIQTGARRELRQSMAPTPQYVKSVSVTAHDAEVTVTASYKSHEGDDILESVTLAVGETHTFPESTRYGNMVCCLSHSYPQRQDWRRGVHEDDRGGLWRQHPEAHWLQPPFWGTSQSYLNQTTLNHSISTVHSVTLQISQMVLNHVFLF